MYQTSDSDKLVWHVIAQAAEYSKHWKLVKKSQEQVKEIAYKTCDPMVSLIAFSNTNDISYVGINTIKIWGKNSTFCLKHIKLNKQWQSIFFFKFQISSWGES